MQPFIRRLLLVLLVLVGAAGSARAQSAYDIVYLLDPPTRVRGTVVSLSSTEVQIDAGGRVQDVDVLAVSKVTFADDPNELRVARDQIRVGQYQTALENLNEITADSVSREMVRQDVEFYKALAASRLALTEGGDAQDALRLMGGFLTKVRRSDNASHHYFEACEVYGDLQLMQGNFDMAARVYQELEEAPWPELSLHSLVLQANALQLEGKFPEAAQKFGQVVSEAPGTPEGNRQKLLATVGGAACQAEAGQHEQAIVALQRVIDENIPDQENVEVFARAYNGLGAAYRKAGKTQEALLAYLHVDLLFNGNPEAHAEALYHLTQIWNELRMNDRAIQARGLLQQRYSSSVWASRQ